MGDLIVPSIMQDITNVGSGNAEAARTRDAHLGLRFWVQINSVEIAGFTECSGLTVTTETEDYAEGGLNSYYHRLPKRTKYENLSLKRGIDEGQELYRWYMRTLSGEIKRQSLSIMVYSPLQKEVRRWDLKEAYPVKWVGPDLKTDAGAVAVESVEIAHHGLLPTDKGVESRLQAIRRSIGY